ncbi:glycosyltransferase [Corallococcus interemptor]|uniref:glycosyltransferase n=1 Tax=Corallococcus interemptor TaxID=2316720 RepID=UPI003CFE9DBC
MHIHQLVTRLAWGDAIGNQVRYLQSLLRSWGHTSEIYADSWDDACKEQVRPAKSYPREATRDSVLLVHHSFESRQVPLIARSRGRKLLVYHNITPARLFEGYDRGAALSCDTARVELLALRPHVDGAFAYSRFSAEELVAAGYPRVDVLPFAIDWNAFDTPPDPSLMAELDDGCSNILFVGRAVPSKYVDDVLRVFTAYQRLYQPRSRLLIAGNIHRDAPYGSFLHGLKDLLGPERIQFLGRVNAAQLSACFASATAYLSMSRHEGFGVPLLEAMYRDVPVVAYGAAAVPETMGGAGLTTFSREPMDVAQLLAVLERDSSLRQQVLAAQRARVAALSQQAVATQVRNTLLRWLGARDAGPAATPSEAPAIELVCPGFTSRPDAPMSRLARELHRRLPDSRILALRGRGEEPVLSLGPRTSEGASVWHFTPDQPVGPAPEPLPGSSSLETAVRASSGKVVLLGTDSGVSQALLGAVGRRGWGVRDAATVTDEAATEAARHHLGPRLLELDRSDLDAVANTLVQGLSSKRGARHARR